MKRILSIVLTLVLLLTALPLALGVSAAETTWKLVTNISQLEAGSRVVIVAKDSNVALSTVQNNNNRAQVSITKGTDSTVTINSSVQILTLEAGKVSNSFAFNTGAGYLYAASSSKNYLRTETTLSDNSSWSITIAADGVATIKAQGSNTRNWLRHNQSSSLFACYASGQNNICLYVETESGSNEPACEHTGEIAYDKNNEQHWSVCDDCGEEITDTRETHDFSNGNCVCGQEKPESVYDVTKDYYMAATDTDGTVYYFSGITNGGGNISTDVTKAITLNIEFDGISYYIYKMDGQTKSYLKSGDGTQLFSFGNTPCAFSYSSKRDTLYEKEYTRAPVVYINNNNERVNIRAYAEGTDSNFTKNLVVKFVVAPDAVVCTHANEEDGEVITEATYFKEGLKEIVCADCGEFIRNEAIACDTAAPVVYTYSYDAAANALTINWTYSKAFETDMLKATEVMFNFELAGYSKDLAINDAQLGGTVTLTGFNAERLSETLYIGLNVKISDVANTSKFDEAAVKEFKVADIANNEKLNTLLDALKADGADTIVNGQVANTDLLVSNTAKLDVKAATAELRITASQELVDTLAALGKEGRTVTLTVKIGDDFTKDIVINDLRKVTIVKISGLSFEQLNSDISVKLAFDYEADANDFATDEIVFACGDMIANADTTVADLFATYMN